jgi:hypothetical protein
LVLDLEVLPDGDLIAAGQFVFAGDFVSISLARWTDAGIP